LNATSDWECAAARRPVTATDCPASLRLSLAQPGPRPQPQAGRRSLATDSDTTPPGVTSGPACSQGIPTTGNLNATSD